MKTALGSQRLILEQSFEWSLHDGTPREQRHGDGLSGDRRRLLS
jgi:hypothetical protein